MILVWHTKEADLFCLLSSLSTAVFHPEYIPPTGLCKGHREATINAVTSWSSFFSWKATPLLSAQS